jgi:NTE family protein
MSIFSNKKCYNLFMKKEKKIGLALSGGAARGYAQIPIIQKLEKENIEIDMISGSSAGALIGAYFAIYGEVTSLKKKLEELN